MRDWAGWVVATVMALMIFGGIVVAVWLWFVIFGGGLGLARRFPWPGTALGEDPVLFQSVLDRARRGWPHAQKWGLRLTAIATGVAGVVGISVSPYSLQGPAPSLAAPFAIAGLGLLVAAVLMAIPARSDLIEIIIGGLAGGSFGVTLAEMSAQAATIQDHYKSLWLPAFLAALLVSFLAFRSDSSG